MKIEYLAHYLPYGLSVWIEHDLTGEKRWEIAKMVSLDYTTWRMAVKFHNDDLGGENIIVGRITDFKPFLRPLSDFPKNSHYQDILDEFDFELEYIINTYGDEKLLFSNKFDNEFSFDEFHEVTQKLLEWHFDIFGLIDKGIARDINEIKDL